jgi:hypothetical protein
MMRAIVSSSSKRKVHGSLDPRPPPWHGSLRRLGDHFHEANPTIDILFFFLFQNENDPVTVFLNVQKLTLND